MAAKKRTIIPGIAPAWPRAHRRQGRPVDAVQPLAPVCAEPRHHLP